MLCWGNGDLIHHSLKTLQPFSVDTVFISSQVASLLKKEIKTREITNLWLYLDTVQLLF